MNAPSRPPIFVALDVPTAAGAAGLARRLQPYVGGFKIGLELFTSAGPAVVEEIGAADVFLDLKFHDIPNTVRGATRAAARLGVMICNVHCLGGATMMRAAVDTARETNAATKVIGVTILTSHDAAELQAIGLEPDPAGAVRRLARLAREAGLDGVVCSPHEIVAVREECGRDFLIVTPGVRPATAELGDQKRVMTPQQALAAGADWLVIGRPITAAADPIAAAQQLLL
jgi:orotidine-5'-phosphate decarboxylase